MRKYGQVLAKLRKERNMTQQELGKRLNISYQAVSKWENDLSQPDLNTLHNMAEIFGISFAELIQLLEGDTQTNSEAKKEELHKEVEKTADFRSSLKKWFWGYVCGGLGALILIFALIVGLVPIALSGSAVYKKVESSVFSIVTSDGNSGTGFFIDGKGTAVTNYSLLKYYKNAVVTLSDKKCYNISKIVGFDEEKGIVIFKVDKKKTKPIRFANSNRVKLDDEIYSVGYTSSSPKSFLSEGFVLEKSISGNRQSYFQISSDLVSIKSGWAVLNKSGKLIGITTKKDSLFNTVLPSNSIKSIKKNKNLTLEEFYEYGRPHNVSFYANEECVRTLNVDYAKCVDEFDFQIEGYTFENWYADEDFKKLFNFSKPIKSNTKVYAKLIPFQFNVTFVPNGGQLNSASKVKVNYDENVTLPVPEYTGYSLVGWFDEDNNKIEDGAWKKLQDCTLTAEWEVANYSVEYEYFGAKPVNNVTEYTYFSPTITLLPASKTGYDFDGWYTDASFSNKIEEIKANSVGDLKLYAKFTPHTILITFSVDEGESVEISQMSVEFDSEIVLPNATRDGYTLKQWQGQANGYNIWRDYGKPIVWNFDYDVVLKPIWTANKYNIYLQDYVVGKEITVTFETFGAATIAPQVVTKDNQLTYPKRIPKKAGYLFTGWYLDEECTELYDFNAKMTEDFTLYAGFTLGDNVPFMCSYEMYSDSVGSYSSPINHPNHSHILQLSANQKSVSNVFYALADGELEVSVSKYGYGNSCEAYKYEIFDEETGELLTTINGKENYTWSGTVNVVAGHLYRLTLTCLDGYRYSNNYKVGAVFPVPQPIKLVSEDDKVVKKVEVTYDKSFVLPYGDETNKKAYYCYVGGEKVYLTDANGKSLSNYAFAQDIKVYMEDEDSTITYVLNGGTNNPNNKETFDDNEVVQLYAPTQHDYTFLGWYLQRDFSGEPVTEVSGFSCTVYAKWKELFEYTLVEYDDYVELTKYNGNDKVIVIPQYYGDKPITNLYSTFEGCESVEKIYTSQTLKKVIYRAFYAPNLKEVHISSSVEEIGNCPYHQPYYKTAISFYIDSSYILKTLTTKNWVVWADQLCGGMLATAKEIFVLKTLSETENIAFEKTNDSFSDIRYDKIVVVDGKEYYRFYNAYELDA